MCKTFVVLLASVKHLTDIIKNPSIMAWAWVRTLQQEDLDGHDKTMLGFIAISRLHLSKLSMKNK